MFSICLHIKLLQIYCWKTSEIVCIGIKFFLAHGLNIESFSHYLAHGIIVRWAIYRGSPVHSKLHASLPACKLWIFSTQMSLKSSSTVFSDQAQSHNLHHEGATEMKQN